jgi:hypothetical protein
VQGSERFLNCIGKWLFQDIFLNDKKKIAAMPWSEHAITRELAVCCLSLLIIGSMYACTDDDSRFPCEMEWVFYHKRSLHKTNSWITHSYRYYVLLLEEFHSASKESLASTVKFMFQIYRE